MKTKTWLTMLAISVMTAGLLVGCGGGDPAMDVPAGGQGVEPGMTTPETETETPKATEETAAPEAEAAPEATTTE
jgi:hypothetical protein